MAYIDEKFDVTKAKQRMLEEYMRRRVSGMGTWISERAYAVGIAPKDMYDLLNEAFCNPTGKPRGLSALGEIDEDIMYNHRGKAVYNYFDLDTLVSYARFLQQVQENMYKASYGRYKNKITSRDISQAVALARGYMSEKAGKLETHGYNPNRPLGLIRDENGKLAPKATMTPKNFEKKYDEKACEEALDDYLNFGLEHGEIISFGGKKYEVGVERILYTKDLEPIRYIRAGRRDGMLLGYLNLDGNPFRGKVYEMVDDEQKYYDDANGLEVLSKDNVPNVKKFDKLYFKSPLQKNVKIKSGSFENEKVR